MERLICIDLHIYCRVITLPKYRDPKTNKFISEKDALKRGIKPQVVGLNYNASFEKYLNDEAKNRGIPAQDIAADLFNNEFGIIEFDEATGKASFEMYSGSTDVAIEDMKPEALMAEYKLLRETFPPVSAGIEYHKTFLCGGGFDIIEDDPRDKHKVLMKETCQKLAKNISMDYYREGLDKLLYMLADPILTYGMAAAEIIYGRDIEFTEFAEPSKETINGKVIEGWTTRMPTISEWKSFKGITRLKILPDANSRLIPHFDPKTFEMKYWSLDSKVQKTVSQDIAERAGVIQKKTGTLFNPFSILWLSWNTRGVDLKGISIIRPVLEMARLVRKIQAAIGKGFERWADKKYFFVCGSDKRPWNKNSQRRFVKYLELMIKNHWTGVPVPTGFDVKTIGGEVFEGTNILDHLISMICAGMNYPRDFLEQGKSNSGDKGWLAWQVKYSSNQRLFRQDVENQIFQKHLWCNFGKTYKVPKQNVDEKKQEKRDIYIPQLLWKAEGQYQRAEETKSLQGWLNVANPIGPEFKLAVEKRGAEIAGLGSIDFPTHAELRKQIKMETKIREIQLQQMIEKKENNDSEEKIVKNDTEKQVKSLEKRQDKGVSLKLSETGKEKKAPPKSGSSRKAKTVQSGMKSKS